MRFTDSIAIATDSLAKSKFFVSRVFINADDINSDYILAHDGEDLFVIVVVSDYGKITVCEWHTDAQEAAEAFRRICFENIKKGYGNA